MKISTIFYRRITVTSLYSKRMPNKLIFSGQTLRHQYFRKVICARVHVYIIYNERNNVARMQLSQLNQPSYVSSIPLFIGFARESEAYVAKNKKNARRLPKCTKNQIATEISLLHKLQHQTSPQECRSKCHKNTD